MQSITRITLLAAALPLAFALATTDAGAVETDVPLTLPTGAAPVPPSGGSGGAPTTGYCIDTIDASHVLTETVAGSTLSGAVMRTMTVYSNGLVVLAAMDGPTGRSHADILVVDRVAVQDLAVDLVTLGASRVCDSPLIVSDTPATTVTFSNGGADAHSHSFTYQVAAGEHLQIAGRIDQFVFEHVLAD